MQTRNILLVVGLISIASILVIQKSNSPKVSQFQQWKINHAITYQTNFQNFYRQAIFLENKVNIDLHNQDQTRTYDMGLNQFTALTQQQFQSIYLGYIPKDKLQVQIHATQDVYVGDVDWTTQGAVTPIKNQGQCGSCWAFSTTGSLQGLSKLSFNQLQSFSEQQLVDCSTIEGNMGCNGGKMTAAFRYVKSKGIVHQSQYPYKAVKQACAQHGGDFKIGGFKQLLILDCSGLANALIGRPISVAVDARKWSPYRSGIFNSCGLQLDHGVLLVGATNQYWKVKNSWGTTWGQQGFIRLARGNTCGICTQPSYPQK